MRKNEVSRYALLSVYDKTGIVQFARSLVSLGFTIISTGGTAKTLTEAGIPVTPINDITGNPESFDGRMKTISFEIESGILFDRSNPSYVKEAQQLGVKHIDIVVSNLYPFEQTIGKSDVSIEKAIENIDVGRPAMVRAAAKNFRNVFVVIDLRDYDRVIAALQVEVNDNEFKRDLTVKAFDHLSFYDAQVARFLRLNKS